MYTQAQHIVLQEENVYIVLNVRSSIYPSQNPGCSSRSRCCLVSQYCLTRVMQLCLYYCNKDIKKNVYLRLIKQQRIVRLSLLANPQLDAFNSNTSKNCRKIGRKMSRSVDLQGYTNKMLLVAGRDSSLLARGSLDRAPSSPGSPQFYR